MNHLDFCVKSSDEAYHHPFQCTFQLAARSIVRVRSDASAQYTENRRTKNGPSGDGKIGANPLPLLPHGISPIGTLDTEGIIEDGN